MVNTRNMYLLKKPRALSPSIPRHLLNSKGTKVLKNDVVRFQSGSSSDFESVGDEGSEGSSSDFESVGDEGSVGSSSAFSTVEQARFADSFECNFGAPLAASTPCSPNTSFFKGGRGVLPEAAKYCRSFERNFEKEVKVEKSRVTRNEPVSSFDEFEQTPVLNRKGSSSDFSPVEQFRNAEMYPEAPKFQNHFKRSIEKQSKSSPKKKKLIKKTLDYKNKTKRLVNKRQTKSNGTSSAVPEVEPTKNLCYNKAEGCLLVNKKRKGAKGTSKQEPEMEPTKSVLPRYEGNICPLGIDLVPGPSRPPSPSFFDSDASIDDIYFLIKGINKSKWKKMRSKRSKENKSRKK